jgi:hypothetical protein
MNLVACDNQEERAALDTRTNPEPKDQSPESGCCGLSCRTSGWVQLTICDCGEVLAASLEECHEGL